MSDQSKQPFWNLKTALCWIAIRQARDVSLLYLQLEHNLGEGEETASSEQLESRFADAESELIGALGRGYLVATGRECVPLDATATNTAGLPQNDIPSRFWNSAHLDVDGNRATPTQRNLWHWWQFGNIRLDADAVRALWPENVPTPIPRDTGTATSTTQPKEAPPLLPKHDLEEFLRAMEATQGSVPAKRAAERQAKAEFPEHRVTRKLVEATHKRLYGNLSPGKRVNKP